MLKAEAVPGSGAEVGAASRQSLRFANLSRQLITVRVTRRDLAVKADV